MKLLKNVVLPLSAGILGLLIFNSCSVRIPEGATAVKDLRRTDILENGTKLPASILNLRKTSTT